MSLENNAKSISQDSKRAPTHSPASATPLTQVSPTLLPTNIPALLNNPNIRNRGNAPVQQRALLQMQRTQGNRAVQRLLAAQRRSEFIGVSRPESKQTPLPVRPSPSAATRGSSDAFPVQRLIEYDSSLRVYEGNEKRPGWNKAAEEKLAKEYTEEQGNTYTGQKLDYKSNKLDRAHEYSFNEIQNRVVDYLNSPSISTKQSLDYMITQLLTGSDTVYEGRVTDALDDLVAQLNKKKNTNNIVSSANSLLSVLNSVPQNLRAANKYGNAYMQDNPDLKFEQKLGQQNFSLTDHSKAIITIPNQSAILVSPGGTSVMASEGKVQYKDMSPGSHSLLTKLPTTKRKIKSANTQKLFNNPRVPKPLVSAPNTTGATGPVTTTTSITPTTSVLSNITTATNTPSTTVTTPTYAATANVTPVSGKIVKVAATLTLNGQPVPGAILVTKWHFKKEQTITAPAPTDTNGETYVTKHLGSASHISIDVQFTDTHGTVIATANSLVTP